MTLSFLSCGCHLKFSKIINLIDTKFNNNKKKKRKIDNNIDFNKINLTISIKIINNNDKSNNINKNH
jgi:hypothetical protein